MGSYTRLSIGLIGLLLLFSSCRDEEPAPPSTHALATTSECQDQLFANGKMYEANGRTYLWAGENEPGFDISNWRLDECMLQFGTGREEFPALISPEYIDIDQMDDQLAPSEKCIVLHGQEEVKVYPFTYMVLYEAVNETIDGAPVLIAYCVIADLAEVYSRQYCGQELTFGVSSYLYSDDNEHGVHQEICPPGTRSFLLWDRDTESLWWPLIHQGVSGPMARQTMTLHNDSDWEVLTWSEVLSMHPDASILLPSQDFVRPLEWPTIDREDLDC